MTDLSPEEIKKIRDAINEGFCMLQKNHNSILEQIRNDFEQIRNNFKQDLVALENNLNRMLERYQQNLEGSFDRTREQKPYPRRTLFALHEERRSDGSIVPWFRD